MTKPEWVKGQTYESPFVKSPFGGVCEGSWDSGCLQNPRNADMLKPPQSLRDRTIPVKLATAITQKVSNTWWTLQETVCAQEQT